jgi:hypothetical protein
LLSDLNQWAQYCHRLFSDRELKLILSALYNTSLPCHALGFGTGLLLAFKRLPLPLLIDCFSSPCPHVSKSLLHYAQRSPFDEIIRYNDSLILTKEASSGRYKDTCYRPHCHLSGAYMRGKFNTSSFTGYFEERVLVRVQVFSFPCMLFLRVDI